MSELVKHPPTFDNAYDFYKELGISVEITDPKTEFSIYKIDERSTPPQFKTPVFRSNFFAFAFFKDALGRCSIDGNVFDTMPGIVYFNGPGHLKQSTMNYVREVFYVTLSEGFLQENVHSRIFDEFPFLLDDSITPKIVERGQFAEFEELCLLIQRAYLSCSPNKYKLVGHLFVGLLIKLKEAFCMAGDVGNRDRAFEIVRRFKVLLDNHYRDLRNGTVDRSNRVSEYANQLNIHPNYLSALMKEKTGRTVSGWIAEKTIVEAKSFLRHTDMPVKEIAYRLGFGEVQHFSGYFKKHTRLSPVEFRQKGSVEPPSLANL